MKTTKSNGKNPLRVETVSFGVSLSKSEADRLHAWMAKEHRTNRSETAREFIAKQLDALGA